jgi:uncharacterized membrane protein
MDDDSQTAPRRPTFRAVLTPHRSLGPTGFLVLMSAVTLVSFLAGLTFYAIGAWPVMGFFGLDVLLLFVAFRLNYRDARAAEIVELDEDHLTLRRITASRETTSWQFNPAWVRLQVDERPSGECALMLCSAGQSVRLARELSDPERREFARAFGDAIARWRRG